MQALTACCEAQQARMLPRGPKPRSGGSAEPRVARTAAGSVTARCARRSPQCRATEDATTKDHRAGSAAAAMASVARSKVAAGCGARTSQILAQPAVSSRRRLSLPSAPKAASVSRLASSAGDRELLLSTTGGPRTSVSKSAACASPRAATASCPDDTKWRPANVAGPSLVTTRCTRAGISSGSVTEYTLTWPSLAPTARRSPPGSMARASTGLPRVLRGGSRESWPVKSRTSASLWETATSPTLAPSTAAAQPCVACRRTRRGCLDSISRTAPSLDMPPSSNAQRSRASSIPVARSMKRSGAGLCSSTASAAGPQS
mmetsp:Transcript_26069/g.82436  ORF Transcript_26069/g.82436 Transcript_26069/m.82436 type:complete len:317 (-) Transcript_26069:1483-2433(-)